MVLIGRLVSDLRDLYSYLMENTTNTETCQFAHAHGVECGGNNEVRRVNGTHTTICDAHFYEMVDASMSLW